MSSKVSFVMHLRYIEAFKDLSGDDVKQLMLTIGEYVEHGIVPEYTDAGLKMAFNFIRSDLDRDAIRWEETKLKRVEAGRKGGIASAENRKQNEANQANA